MQNHLTIAGAITHHLRVPAQSGAGFSSPNYSRRNAPIRRFFVASCPAYGGVQWEAFGPAGSYIPVRQPVASRHPWFGDHAWWFLSSI